ncbi:PREDICTED: odorant receptor 22c-like [Papilio xuthus]|uniref:Odorant receptor n=1 Tax=Papilio xuthus TaxID=66420 RepID=A0AAJ7E7B1_PAPXU|nr:PREDICTED: odorant receptor 22c-like [Papilio xuthus]
MQKTNYLKDRAFHLCSFIFVISQIIDIYFMRNDFNKVLLNISITALSFIAICKTISCLLLQSRLQKVINAIKDEEDILYLNDKFEIKRMKNYKNYARLITYLYWLVIFITSVVTIIAPFLKYASSSSYREEIKNGTEPYPQIISSWFPFDNNKMPGYFFATLIHTIMTIQGAGVVAVYDANAVSIMTFLKGQFIILQEKCRRIFGAEDVNLTKSEIYIRIKECHRRHNFLLGLYSTFNSMISPVMHLYVLVCSINICCSVIQLNLDNVATSQKIWVFEYVSALSIQLFLLCWHSNEIKVESDRADRGVYESNWWKADPSERKQLLLLAGKLAPPYIMKAGPFTDLSIPTFIDIMKGTYSFYTLFTHIQEKRE